MKYDPEKTIQVLHEQEMHEVMWEQQRYHLGSHSPSPGVGGEEISMMRESGVTDGMCKRRRTREPRKGIFRSNNVKDGWVSCLNSRRMRFSSNDDGDDHTIIK